MLLDAMKNAVTGESRALTSLTTGFTPYTPGGQDWHPNAARPLGAGDMFQSWTTSTGEGIDLSPDAIYSSQPAVRTVVSFRARHVSRVPLHSYMMDSSTGARSRSRDTPLADLFGKPSTTATQFSFMDTLMHDRDLWDRYCAVVRYDDATGWHIDRIPPRRWRFDRDGRDQPRAVKVLNETGDRVGTLSLEQCMWIDNYPTASRTPMECIQSILIEEGESNAARRDMWEGRARIPQVITRPSSAPSWSPAARDNFKAGWKRFAGRGGRSGETPILEDDMQLHDVKVMTAVDAQQIESRRLAHREVAAFWHVQPVMVGDSEGSNYSNAQAFKEQLYDMLGADFAAVEQTINAQVVPRVAPDSGEFAEFDVKGMLRMSFKEQAEFYAKALGPGVPWMLQNEIRKMENLGPVPGGDDMIIPINVQPPSTDDEEAG